ncbi:Phosphatidylinositol 3,4,5-trisphosphate-dependent Rac exchanger 2 protein, partial [Elasticomyces elasticus]
MALTRSTDPLVWIDCEMTGLNPTTDSILSICCMITDHKLNPIPVSGTAYNAVIRTPKSVLDSMSQWCIDTHGRTGLTAACQSDSAITAEQAATALRKFIESHIPSGTTTGKPLLAGNSVHADKMFLMQSPWDIVLEPLHYRIFDVSAIKEAARRWCSEDVLRRAPEKRLVHAADDDVRESIEEARFYMGLFETREL